MLYNYTATFMSYPRLAPLVGVCGPRIRVWEPEIGGGRFPPLLARKLRDGYPTFPTFPYMIRPFWSLAELENRRIVEESSIVTRGPCSLSPHATLELGGVRLPGLKASPFETSDRWPCGVMRRVNCNICFRLYDFT